MDIGNKCTMSREDILKNLEEGLKSENQAKTICEDISALLEEGTDKEQIQRIIADEEKHIKITEKLMEAVDTFYTGKDQ